MVDNSENRVISVGEGKIGDKVHADVHPRCCAWLKRDSGAGRLCVAFLEAGTLIAVRDVSFDIRGQSGPIVLVFNKFLGFLITRVASDRGVVMCRDDFHVQGIIVGDIHPTRGIIEEAIAFLADPFLFA